MCAVPAHHHDRTALELVVCQPAPVAKDGERQQLLVELRLTFSRCHVGRPRGRQLVRRASCRWKAIAAGRAMQENVSRYWPEGTLGALDSEEAT